MSGPSNVPVKSGAQGLQDLMPKDARDEFLALLTETGKDFLVLVVELIVQGLRCRRMHEAPTPDHRRIG
jgi:hypothetical protein